MTQVLEQVSCRAPFVSGHETMQAQEPGNTEELTRRPAFQRLPMSGQ